MTQVQYAAFTLFRDAFRAQIPQWMGSFPVVYNSALDRIQPITDIRLIVAGDNPGARELATGEYMVGMSGKLARVFFTRHPELGIDWENNVIVLNKTPLYTPKTADLRRLAMDERAKILLHDSQVWMARHTVDLHRGIGCALWIVGYGELRHGGVFEAYKDVLSSSYSSTAIPYPKIYQHFSMNRFNIDFAKWQSQHAEQTAQQALQSLGEKHRRDILGW